MQNPIERLVRDNSRVNYQQSSKLGSGLGSLAGAYAGARLGGRGGRAGAIIGGLFGAWMVRRVPERPLRIGIVVIGLLLTVGLFVRRP